MSSGFVKFAPDPRFHIGVRDLHVWHAELTNVEGAKALQPLLSPDESERAARFRFPEHQRRFVIARGFLRQLLAAYLGIEARDVTFTYSENAKPELSELHRGDIFFNASHSGDLAAFAFAVGRKVGVDVECIRHDVDVDEIPRRFFSPHEQQALAALEDGKKIEGFFNCWTR